MSLPERIAPMLARLAARPFDSPAYLFEVKWDGTRCLAFVERGGVRLQNRRFHRIEWRYPELAVLAGLERGSVLDGEVVVLHEGRADFERLQRREQAPDPARAAALARVLPATYVAFDLLYERGRAILRRPLEERRERLRALVAPRQGPALLFSEHVAGAGRRFFDEVTAAGHEGVMAKRRDSPYLPGVRSRAWLKVKAQREERFAVIGYLPRPGEAAVSSLLLGERAGGRWRYRGRVAAGLGERARRALHAELSRLPPLGAPVAGAVPARARLVRTGLRARVRYQDLTRAGLLRAPVLLGLERVPA